jgi:hypothetical protein
MRNLGVALTEMPQARDLADAWRTGGGTSSRRGSAQGRQAPARHSARLRSADGDLRRTAVAAPHGEGQPTDIAGVRDALTMFSAAWHAAPTGTPCLLRRAHHLPRARRDRRRVRRRAAKRGLQRSDRVAMYLQGVPQFIIRLDGTWKAGRRQGVVSPMNRERARPAEGLGREGARLPAEPVPRRRGVRRRRHGRRHRDHHVRAGLPDRNDPRAPRGGGAPRTAPRTCWSSSSASAGRHRRRSATGRTTSRSSPTPPAPRARPRAR